MNLCLQKKSKLFNAKAKLSELKKKYSKNISVGITNDAGRIVTSSDSEQSEDGNEGVDEYVIRQESNDTTNQVTTISKAVGLNRNTGIKIEINQRCTNSSETDINVVLEKVENKLKSADSFSMSTISSNNTISDDNISSENSIKSELPDQLENVNFISSTDDDSTSFTKSTSEINNKESANSKIKFQRIGDVTADCDRGSRSTEKYSDTVKSRLTHEYNSKSPQQYLISTASNSTISSVAEIEEEADLEHLSNEAISDVNYNGNLNSKDITSLEFKTSNDPNLKNQSVNSKISPKISKIKAVKDMNRGTTLQSKLIHLGANNNLSTNPARGNGSNRSVKNKTTSVVNKIKGSIMDKKECKHINSVSLENNQIRRLKPSISTLKTNLNSTIRPTESTPLGVCDVNTQLQILQHCPTRNELVQTSSRASDYTLNYSDIYNCDNPTTQLLKNQIQLIKHLTESHQQMYMYFCQAINLSKM